MIQKIERIISVGKFRNYQASGDVAFRKLTLIYGDNGGGKTTLTAILRSLSLDHPEIILQRVSTNSTTNPQSVQIIQRAATGDIHHTFRNTGWSTRLPNIEIFDIHFINANVYSGFNFSEDHKTNLHEFVIGAQGVALQQLIEANKNAKTQNRQRQTDLIAQIVSQVGNGLFSPMITGFLGMARADIGAIDGELALATTALANARNNSIIQSLQQLSFHTILNSGINFPDLINDLETSIQTIQEGALRDLFILHSEDLAANGVEDTELWLRKGLGYVHAKTTTLETSNVPCPFCKQPIDEHFDIIRAYTSHFNEEFNALARRLHDHLRSIQNFNLTAFIQSNNTTCQTNTDRITLWHSHLPNTLPPPINNIIQNVPQLESAFQSLISVVTQKVQNPTLAIETQSLRTIQSLFEECNERITLYNQAVTLYNSAIRNLKSSIETETQVQTQFEGLMRIKLRWDPTIDQLCNELIFHRNELVRFDSEYQSLMEQQEALTSAFFLSYSDRINHYLSATFRTHFQISGVENVRPLGKAKHSKIGYKLTIDGQDISFDHAQPNNVRDCLSEGDKSTIALAFFLAKLDIDANVHDSILVFDDPLSSFDSNRRQRTVHIITDLATRMKQVVVLSHNELFLYELTKGSTVEKKTLRITEDFNARASILEDLDLQELVENDYFKDVKELERFISHADIRKKDDVLGLIRNVLEAHIRFKFYRQIQTAIPNRNNQTLGKLIIALESINVPFRDNTQRVQIISSLRQLNGISCKPHHGEPMPDYNVLGVDPNSLAVPELVAFVQDTLNLIDNQL